MSALLGTGMTGQLSSAIARNSPSEAQLLVSVRRSAATYGLRQTTESLAGEVCACDLREIALVEEGELEVALVGEPLDLRRRQGGDRVEPVRAERLDARLLDLPRSPTKQTRSIPKRPFSR